VQVCGDQLQICEGEKGVKTLRTSSGEYGAARTDPGIPGEEVKALTATLKAGNRIIARIYSGLTHFIQDLHSNPGNLAVLRPPLHR
jgi:hypothetical protein